MNLEKLATMRVQDDGIKIFFKVEPMGCLSYNEFDNGKPATDQTLSDLYQEFKSLITYNLEKNQRYISTERIIIKDEFDGFDTKYSAYLKNESVKIPETS
jgi:hypothetical protein|tara:strand:- start:1932 stop:2231 length:300 start_codon:yes stop_codon:yes gene_type:complete